MLTRLVLYGIFGWCAEIVWTACYGVGTAVRGRKHVDWRLVGQTYLWMFPIYGGGGLLFEVAHRAIASWHGLLRGLVYMIGCFAVEYVSGLIIKLATGKIPWDYSYSRWSVHGLIRLDYIPVWFAFGLLLERVEAIVRRVAPLVF